ncbi:uncharacterized protein FFE2_10121 [Fusarium fujikuroi]|nr:uncharacterized protein FFE2_10121 [Fusarium fujikuroi]
MANRLLAERDTSPVVQAYTEYNRKV